MPYLFHSIILLLVVLCTACAGNVNSQSVPTPAPTADLPTNEAGAPVVAHVNGQAITLAETQRMVARYGQQTGMDAAMLQDMALQTLIEQALIEQAAVEQGVTVADSELDAQVEASAELAGGAEAWQNWLRDNLYTEAEFRDSLRDSLITSRMRDLLTSQLDGIMPQVRARHILVQTEAEARDILTRLQNGEDFAALAGQHSLDVTTRENGGDLGWFVRDELLEPALADQTFALQPGEVVGPVQTSLGFHIVQLLEKADRPLAEDKRALVAQMRFEHWLSDLVSDATIERYL